MNHRTPPLHIWRKGFCRWCDNPLVPRLKKNGEPRRIQAAMHSECGAHHWAAQNTSILRDNLIERDGKRCFDCEKAPYSWEPRKPPMHRYEYLGGEYCEVEFRLILDVDHNVPLWKVARLPIKKRQWFFTIENLRLRCRPCHKIKSTKEAAERAHHKRLAKEKKRRGKPLQSPGFSKTLRKKFNGQVVRRV